MNGWRGFGRHYLEMLVAMVVGMVVLMPAGYAGLSWLGWSEVMTRPELSAMAMATTMSLGMSGWMAYRRHSGGAIAEMAAAMYASFAVFFVPLWLGLISGETMMIAGHVLMLPAMLVVMLRRPSEYLRHRHHGSAPRRATDDADRAA
ncbi:MAG TPA: hypothetical protein VFT31_18300 [Kribbella sp.]|nr:hypothetical protein [Kribbella sp.]